MKDIDRKNWRKINISKNRKYITYNIKFSEFLDNVPTIPQGKNHSSYNITKLYFTRL